MKIDTCIPRDKINCCNNCQIINLMGEKNARCKKYKKIQKKIQKKLFLKEVFCGCKKY